jgi:UDP-glucose 6-dehydrogenase
MAFTKSSSDPELIKEVQEATEKRRQKDAIVEKLQEKKRRIEKTAKALLEIEYKNKIDDFLQNKLPLLEDNKMSPSVAKALLQVEMEEKIDSMMKSGQGMKMVLNEIPMLVDNILEDNMNQIKLLESKNTITDDDVEAYEEHKKEVDQQGSISKEELAKKWGVKV